MKVKSITVSVLVLLLIGCTSSPPDDSAKQEQRSQPFSFVVTLPNHTKFRITPDMQKLAEVKALRPIPGTTQPISERFQRVATERILAESKRNPDIDIRTVVFSQITGRDESGRSFPPMKFTVGDYAVVERLE